MSLLAMDRQLSFQLVTQHVSHADRSRRWMGVVTTIGGHFASWANRRMTAAVVGIIDRYVSDFRDQAIWFSGMANKIGELPIGEPIDPDFVMGDRLRLLEERLSGSRAELLAALEQRGQRTGETSGPKMDAVRRVLAALEAVEDSAGDLRASLQAYEASRSTLARASRKVCNTPDELTADLHEHTL